MVSAALRLPPRQFGLEGHLWDGKLLAAHLAQAFGVTLGVRQCQRLLRQFGFRLRKPRPLIAHADRVEQAAVKKLRRLAGDKSVDLWSLDEVHFQQYGSRCRTWAPPENRDPVLLHHPTRRSVGYFGAVHLRDGRFLCRRFLDFLRQFSWANRATRRRMVLILDNASYHHARMHKPWRGTQAKRVSFEFLLAYSLELNPIERVWKFTRRRCVHNRYFPQLERVIETMEREFAARARHSESLRRLCAFM